MSTMGHILVVDDDAGIRELLARFLRTHGFRVDHARNGIEMRHAMGDAEYDLVVLDIMMPGEGGLSLCHDLRSRSRVPVIMLTAMGDEADRVVGLEMGADDYVPKPFSPRELLARIRAVLRRSTAAPETGTPRSDKVQFAGWMLDKSRRELTTPDGVTIDLTGGDFDLLVAFAENPNRVLTRDQLYDITRGRSAPPLDRSIDVHVSRLRRKLEHCAGGHDIIKTVRGSGYVFAAIVEPA
ncbi:response regulator transcription factor [Skermanella mucosa]|uniref:response regulator n=1 Tax=Skermanella mucosa TaxID=1789672 RepID=UPI00192B6DDE|nr:response regulator transcription factor [Skermanella mucosa]